MSDLRNTCEICPKGCRLKEGEVGYCKARYCKEGKVIPRYYGKLSSVALDPIEKKPLFYFKPGSWVLSCGSFGCNMSCYFCQNYSISQSAPELRGSIAIEPEQLIQVAKDYRSKGNIGLAFTYNEPLVNYEFVLDCARLAREEDLDFVLVSNGQIMPDPLEELLPYISAWNIDLKSFTEDGYRRLGGVLEVTLHTIRRAAATSYIEVTTLIVPGLSDSESDMKAQAKFLAEIDPDIPLHLTRYFPAYRSKTPPTPLATLYRLENIASRYMKRVRLGNV